MGVGVGLRRPLANVGSIQSKNNVMANTEQVVFLNMMVGIETPTATEVYPAMVTASTPFAVLFCRRKSATEANK